VVRAPGDGSLAGAFLYVLFVNDQVAVSLRYKYHHTSLDLCCQGIFDKLSNMKIPERYEVLDAEALAQLLGFTRSTVLTHLSRQRWDKIPPPSRRLAMGPIWYVGGVQEWQRKK
jgi:hypothetical protein